MTRISPLEGSYYEDLQSQITALKTESEITPTGTTGDQTINKKSGSVNLAANDTSLVVTNSLVTADSVIMATVATNDANTNSAKAIASSGSFTIYPDVAPDSETRVNFAVLN